MQIRDRRRKNLVHRLQRNGHKRGDRRCHGVNPHPPRIQIKTQNHLIGLPREKSHDVHGKGGGGKGKHLRWRIAYWLQRQSRRGRRHSVCSPGQQQEHCRGGDNLGPDVAPQSSPHRQQDHAEQHGERAAGEVRDDRSLRHFLVAGQQLPEEPAQRSHKNHHRKQPEIARQRRRVVEADRYPPASQHHACRQQSIDSRQNQHAPRQQRPQVLRPPSPNVCCGEARRTPRQAQAPKYSGKPHDRHAQRVDAQCLRAQHTRQIHFEQVTGRGGENRSREEHGRLARDVSHLRAELLRRLDAELPRGFHA